MQINFRTGDEAAPRRPSRRRYPDWDPLRSKAAGPNQACIGGLPDYAALGRRVCEVYPIGNEAWDTSKSQLKGVHQ
jgi:hypothetical protein